MSIATEPRIAYLRSDRRLSQADVERLREQWARVHEGIPNAPRIIVLDGGVSFTYIDQPRTWVCTNHDLHYPVGCASVVSAPTEEQARELLDGALIAAKLKPYAASPYTLIELEPGTAVVLNDGNY